ncbi:MAG: plasmid pRiA4b ORF-3 family protein [Polyangia bacterium]
MKVTLSYVEPPVWRRVAVPSHFTLERLHWVLQWVMGWENSHMHAFRIGKRMYGNDPESLDESKVTVGDVLPKKGSKAVYIYDFGDDWMHEVVVEQVGAPDPKVNYPTCIEGQRACPPEDCGGPPGYERLLETLADPEHDEHVEMKDWLGKKFNAEMFGLARVNRELKKVR